MALSTPPTREYNDVLIAFAVELASNFGVEQRTLVQALDAFGVPGTGPTIAARVSINRKRSSEYSAEELKDAGLDAGDSGARTLPPKKKSRVIDTLPAVWELGSNKRITVKSWKGKTRVDLREFYEKDGDLAPGRKGIGLSGSQWGVLRSHVDEVNTATSGRIFEIDSTHRVSVNEWKGKKLVDIREYYMKDGDLAPGKKGLSLSMAQWGALKCAMDEVDDALNL